MDVADLIRQFFDAAAEQPILLVTVLLAVGGIVGAIRVGGFSLGPAGVLFTALAFSAYDDRLILPKVLGYFGLAVFAYVVGIGAGPSFFTALRGGGRAVGVIAGALLAGAGLTVLVAKLLGLHGPYLSGVFAGALTNTPALAAASERWGGEQPTVGYSVAYLFGVLGMLIATLVVLRMPAPKHVITPIIPDELPTAIETMNVRITTADLPDLETLSERFGHKIVFARIMRGDIPGHPGIVDIATDVDQPVPGDILSVIGDKDEVHRFATQFGHPSTVALNMDRSTLDYRRIAVSNPDIVGRPIESLRLLRKFGAIPTRVRRGDVEVLATDDLVLQIGDRVRVVAPPTQMPLVAKYFGDSEKGATHFSLTAMALGLWLGVTVGMLQFPMFGGGTFELGLAAGPMLMGLVLGRLGRTGRLLWTLPHSAATTLQNLGMMLFLAYAGSTAGAALVDALRTPVGVKLFVVGLVVTAVTALIMIVAGREVGGVYGPRQAGMLAGLQTQPAVLAYANERTDDDPRVNLGYALAYPVAMIVKVFVGPFLGVF